MKQWIAFSRPYLISRYINILYPVILAIAGSIYSRCAQILLALRYLLIVANG